MKEQSKAFFSQPFKVSVNRSAQKEGLSDQPSARTLKSRVGDPAKTIIRTSTDGGLHK